MLKMKDHNAYWTGKDDLKLNDMLDNGFIIVAEPNKYTYLIARDNLSYKEYYKILKDNDISYPTNTLISIGIL